MKYLCRILLAAVAVGSLATSAIAQQVGGGGQGGATVNQGTPGTAGNAWFVAPTVGGVAVDSTHGTYFNLLQGNAVNASGNPIFVQITAGAATLGNVGLIAGSAIVGKFGIDQTTPGTTNAVSITPLTNAQGGNLTPVVSAALEASHIFKASAGNLYAAYAVSTTGAAGYFVCINATTISAGAITPIDVVPMGAGPSSAFISYGTAPPGAYSTGITCALTVAATPFTYTAPGSVVYYHGLVD